MHPPLPSKSMYFYVAAGLGILLVATVAVAQVNLGPLNAPIALAIAFVKASLIVLVFMNLRASSPLVRLFAASGLVWMAIMFTFVLADIFTRT